MFRTSYDLFIEIQSDYLVVAVDGLPQEALVAAHLRQPPPQLDVLARRMSQNQSSGQSALKRQGCT